MKLLLLLDPHVKEQHPGQLSSCPGKMSEGTHPGSISTPQIIMMSTAPAFSVLELRPRRAPSQPMSPEKHLYTDCHTTQAEPCTVETRTHFLPQHLQERGKKGQCRAGSAAALALGGAALSPVLTRQHC